MITVFLTDNLSSGQDTSLVYYTSKSSVRSSSERSERGSESGFHGGSDGCRWSYATQSGRFQDGGWTTQQKRCYQRVLTCLKFFEIKARLDGLGMVRVDLTSSPDSSYADLMIHFQILRKRLERRGIKIEYFNVKTQEGHGVLHQIWLITSGQKWISQEWLSDAWDDVHKAFRVWISKYRPSDRSRKKVSHYFVGQYVTSQKGFDRYSWSRRYLSGFVGVWNFLKQFYEGKYLYLVWSRWLGGQTLYFKGFMYCWTCVPPPVCSVVAHDPYAVPLDRWF
jgi:hypothetical protein